MFFFFLFVVVTICVSVSFSCVFVFTSPSAPVDYSGSCGRKFPTIKLGLSISSQQATCFAQGGRRTSCARPSVS